MSFAIRGFNLVESLLRHDEAQLRRFLRRMKSLNFNTLIAHYDYGWKRFGDIILEETGLIRVDVCLMVFGPRTFLASPDFTPQWLAKRRDGKPIITRLECETKPCCHESDAVKAYERGATLWLRSLQPEIKHVHVRCGDGIEFCECELCRDLSEADRWQPFVDAFVRAWQSTRPELSCEVDVYARRYELPTRHQSLRELDRLMYDTFYRHPFVPIGDKSWNQHLMSYATSGAYPQTLSPNEFHLDRLCEWTLHYPGKLYIHENLMMQGYLGIFQHNTGAQLQDIKTYRDLGLQGVVYEAYEMGFEFFEDAIGKFATALTDVDALAEYQAPELERELDSGKWQMPMFCSDIEFPIERYIDDPVEAAHIRNCARFRQQPTLENLRAMVEHTFKHAERFDYLYTGFLGCKLARQAGVDFSQATEDVQHMLSYKKLWDFMEAIPVNLDPRITTQHLILQAIEQATS